MGKMTLNLYLHITGCHFSSTDTTSTTTTISTTSTTTISAMMSSLAGARFLCLTAHGVLLATLLMSTVGWYNVFRNIYKVKVKLNPPSIGCSKTSYHWLVLGLL